MQRQTTNQARRANGQAPAPTVPVFHRPMAAEPETQNAPMKIGEIPMAMRDLQDALVEAESVFAALVARLEPVLQQQPSTLPTDSEGSSCALSQDLKAATSRVRTLVDRINDANAALRL